MSKLKPLPEVLPCPYCGHTFQTWKLSVWSLRSGQIECPCGYRSKQYDTNRGAINAHNSLARAQEPRP